MGGGDGDVGGLRIPRAMAVGSPLPDLAASLSTSPLMPRPLLSIWRAAVNDGVLLLPPSVSTRADLHCLSLSLHLVLL